MLILPILAACARSAPNDVRLGTPVLASAAVTDYGYHNETSIAINPANPRNIIVSYQVPAMFARSEDTGMHWFTDTLPDVKQFQLSGDPLVAFDADGHAYELYIAFDRPEDYDTLGSKAHRNGIFINRSDDGGRTWRSRATPVIAHAEAPGIPFEDKPAIGIDRSSDAGRRGHLYVAWTQFRRANTGILFSRSTDGAQSFGTPVEISDRPGSPKDTVGADEGTSIAIAKDGTVFVVWSDSTGILLDRSTDGGVTFGRDQLVARTPDIVFAAPGVSRANGYPTIAIDEKAGRSYIQWVDRRLGGAAVFLVTSDDNGRSWTAPRNISDNMPSESRSRFFSWMAVDPLTGLLVIGYYREETPGSLSYVLSYSSDRGAHFTHVQMSPPFRPGGEFLGDYTGVDVLGGVAYAVWTDAMRPDTAATVQKSRAPRHYSRVVAGSARFPSR
jgi:hypothetical protein